MQWCRKLMATFFFKIFCYTVCHKHIGTMRWQTCQINSKIIWNNIGIELKFTCVKKVEYVVITSWKPLQDIWYHDFRICWTASMVQWLVCSPQVGVDCGCESWACQTKDYKIGICCFSTKQEVIWSKRKDWLG